MLAIELGGEIGNDGSKTGSNSKKDWVALNSCNFSFQSFLENITTNEDR